MIEYALLIMLGFCVGGLIALLLAPTLWHRAVRLTTKRLEATMPMSLSDIEADKDLLRADYAIQIRKLESGLSKTRDKSANQLVEISKLQMQLGELGDQIAALQIQLEERRNAANVFENTIRKRFPELENMVAAAKTALDSRAQEIEDLSSTLRRREEALDMSQRSQHLQQQEILKLRDTLEQKGADTTGRFKRRPSQWTLDEYRSEYDRLNVELSKLREQLSRSQEREAGQISVLKTELQQLGERMMSSVAAQETRMPAAPQADADRMNRPSPRPEATTRAASPQGVSARSRTPATPWPGEQPMNSAAADAQRPKDRTVPPSPSRAESAPRTTSTYRRTDPVVSPALSAGPATGVDRGENDAATRDALKRLLDRGARPAGADKTSQSVQAPRTDRPAASGTAHASATILSDATSDAGPRPRPATDRNLGQLQPSDAEPAPAVSTADPKLDKVFREIFEGRASSQAPSTSAAPAAEPNGSVHQAAQRAEQTGTPELETADPSKPDSPDANKTRTLLDRLRVMQERQTG